MKLFGKKKTEEKEVKVIKAASKAVVANVGVTHVRKGIASSVIIHPRVTEKSHSLAEGSNVYVFNVRLGVTKGMVSEAMKDLYKVSPIKVAIVPIPKKTRFVRGKAGVAGGGRKAYVYLKKGEKLEIA